MGLETPRLIHDTLARGMAALISGLTSIPQAQSQQDKTLSQVQRSTFLGECHQGASLGVSEENAKVKVGFCCVY